jgi:hypothetical protein
MHPFEYVDWDSDQQGQTETPRLFISHRWISPHHPDPRGEQLREIQSRIKALHNQGDTEALVFYDYCSMLQRPRTVSEDVTFYRDIDSLTSFLRSVEIVLILSEGYADYKNRAWCFFEAIASEGRVHFFDDQAHIKRDLDFLGYLLCEDVSQITSYDFSYKPSLTEAEIVVATVQHLNTCKVTHMEDLPRIKTQMIRFFNDRRLTSFGRLVTALCKYFDVAFAVLPAGGSGEAISCRPFFEKPEWVRLRLAGQSLFAVSPDQSQEMAVQGNDELAPIVRLALPEVENRESFLKSFQEEPDWRQYVVEPMMLGERGDCFPTLRHVIHTVLERPPGFFYSKDSQYLHFPLSGR